ncbi:MAG TPA: hypothetical protein VM779_14785 [Thermoanaerobaculia bacterium]|nr:hypothetical protein [Thermoanaerobaculia bacterium]
MPADYYSAPLSEVKPYLPKWVPWGCGAAALLMLLLMFAGGAMLTGPRLAALFDLVVGMSLGEMKGMYADDITAEQQESFEAAVNEMRAGLRESRIPIEEAQPFLQSMQKAVGDEKVTAEELERLTKIARDASR